MKSTSFKDFQLVKERRSFLDFWEKMVESYLFVQSSCLHAPFKEVQQVFGEVHLGLPIISCDKAHIIIVG